MMTKKEIAEKMLEMLDTQQQYFKTRSSEVLAKSKRLEKEMRALCKSLIEEDETPTIFDPVREMRDQGRFFS
jgi:hypothetical protein